METVEVEVLVVIVLVVVVAVVVDVVVVTTFRSGPHQSPLTFPIILIFD